MTLPDAEHPILWLNSSGRLPSHNGDMEIRPDIVNNRECCGSVAAVNQYSAMLSTGEPQVTFLLICRTSGNATHVPLPRTYSVKVELFKERGAIVPSSKSCSIV